MRIFRNDNHKAWLLAVLLISGGAANAQVQGGDDHSSENIDNGSSTAKNERFKSLGDALGTAMDINLYEEGDSDGEIVDNRQANVTLMGRAFNKDGSWDMLCLPFSVTDGDTSDHLSFSGTPLEGASVKELDADASGFDDKDVLIITFRNASKIEAGKPYIFKWSNGDNSVIRNPKFENVILKSAEPTVVKFNGGQFVGQYAPFDIVPIDAVLGENQGHLNETLYFINSGIPGRTVLSYPMELCTLPALRNHFYVPARYRGPEDILGLFSKMLVNFGDGIETAISELRPDGETVGACGWYSLDGRKLSGEPKAKGIYIHDGRKIMVK